jgi:hypothetical protein
MTDDPTHFLEEPETCDVSPFAIGCGCLISAVAGVVILIVGLCLKSC